MRSACVLRESISLEEDEMRATTIRHQSFASRVRPISSSSANAGWTFISAAILNRRSGTNDRAAPNSRFLRDFRAKNPPASFGSATTVMDQMKIGKRE